MPIVLRYGLFLGLAQTLATLVVYFAGLHATPDKLPTAQFVENLTGFVLMIVFVALGLRAAKAAREARGEVSTFGAGAKTALALAAVGALVSGLGQLAYVSWINPEFLPMLKQMVLDGAKERIATMKPEELAQSMEQLDFALSPAMRGVAQAFGTFVFTTLLGLAFAVVFRAAARREAADQARAEAAPAATDTPPAPPAA